MILYKKLGGIYNDEIIKKRISADLCSIYLKSVNDVMAKETKDDSLDTYVITACPQGNRIHHCISPGWGEIIYGWYISI